MKEKERKFSGNVEEMYLSLTLNQSHLNETKYIFFQEIVWLKYPYPLSCQELDEKINTTEPGGN